MPSSPRCLPRWSLVLLGTCAAICAALAAWKPGLFFVDDAWFYLQIGRNIALGHGSTFDGVGRTNGYHPLWQAIVAGIGWLLSADRVAMRAAVHLLQAVLVGVAGLTLVRAGRRFGQEYSGVVVASVVLGLLADRGWGSEGMLNLALHGAVLLAWSQARGDDRHRDLTTGLLAGLLILARLDTAFFVGALVALQLRRAGPASAARLAIGATLPVLPYLLSNLLLFGGIVPVSGAIKSTFPAIAPGNPLDRLGVVGTATAALGAVSLLLARLPSTPARALLGALGWGTTLHGAYTALYTGSGWSTDVVYYYVTGVINAGFCAAELTRRYLALLPTLRPTGRQALVGSLAAIVAIGGTGRAVRGALAADDGTERLATWLGSHLDPGARILTVDAPGRLAWFSGLPVFALDGLTQPPGFDAALRSPDVTAWAERVGITHVVSLQKPYDAPWVRVEPTPDALVLHVQTPHRRIPAGDIVLRGAPMATVRALLGCEACSEPVGVWPWPDEGR
ncbi:MAG: hypothetical protein D6798_16985 [Deltaproteobacteria bacterium]|nr:MAG: hypothetical protein D6798_16985 [Deltaproteobacteria bacterium]